MQPALVSGPLPHNEQCAIDRECSHPSYVRDRKSIATKTMQMFIQQNVNGIEVLTLWVQIA